MTHTDRAAPYVIAEIGVNHDGSVDRAAEMVRHSAAAGFDAVKFQYWIIDELLAADAPNAGYQGVGDQRDLLANLALDLGALRELRQIAREESIDFVCTADGVRAHAAVMTLAPDALKVGSGDNDNPWLLDAVADSGLPVYVSTGMSSVNDVRATLHRLSSVRSLMVMHCITAYPTALADSALFRIPQLRAVSNRPVGLSDHTLGHEAAVAALALGAEAIEKHVTWAAAAEVADRPGPDHRASLPLAESATWIETLRSVAIALRQGPTRSDEESNRRVVRKGLYARRDLDAGHLLALDDLEPLRPVLDGVPAGARDAVLGSALRNAVPRGTLLRASDLVEPVSEVPVSDVPVSDVPVSDVPAS